MLRIILGMIAGIAASFVTTLLVQMAGHAVFPPPAGLDPTDPDQIAAMMDSLPFGSLVAVVLAWGLGAFAGGSVAILVSKKNWAAWIIAFVVLALTAINLIMIPHPVWMIAAGPLVIALAAFLAVKLFGVKAA